MNFLFLFFFFTNFYSPTNSFPSPPLSLFISLALSPSLLIITFLSISLFCYLLSILHPFSPLTPFLTRSFIIFLCLPIHLAFLFHSHPFTLPICVSLPNGSLFLSLYRYFVSCFQPLYPEPFSRHSSYEIFFLYFSPAPFAQLSGNLFFFFFLATHLSCLPKDQRFKQKFERFDEDIHFCQRPHRIFHPFLLFNFIDLQVESSSSQIFLLTSGNSRTKEISSAKKKSVNRMKTLR